MGEAPSGFAYAVLRSGDVVILRNDDPVTTLRGINAARFLAEVDRHDPQELMARATGNYKRGNERTAREHPRNRDR